MSLDFIRQRKNVIVPVVLLTVAMGLFVYNSAMHPERRVISPFSRAVIEVLSYPQSFFVGITRGVQNLWHRYFYLRGVEEENRVLRRDMDSLSFERQQLLEQLARMRMNLPEVVWGDAKFIHSKIIAMSAREELMTMTLDIGSSRGVKYGMPVMTGLGVVGKIIGGGESREVPPYSSQVLLLTDPRCRVDALVYRMIPDSLPNPACPYDPVNWAQTRVRGIVQGTGEMNKLILKFVEPGADIKPGDRVVSSGLGGIFPKGIYLGAIISVGASEIGLGLKVEMQPAVDFNRIEEVMIMIRESAPQQ